MIMNVPSEGFIRNTMPTKLDIYMFTHKRYNLRQYTNIIYTSVSGIGDKTLNGYVHNHKIKPSLGAFIIIR
jgi:hypothetical protein